MRKDGPFVGFQSVDFGVNSDISVGEDGFILVIVSLDKSIIFFISVSHLASGVVFKVFKDAYLFYSFPFAKNVYA